MNVYLWVFYEKLIHISWMDFSLSTYDFGLLVAYVTFHKFTDRSRFLISFSERITPTSLRWTKRLDIQVKFWSKTDWKAEGHNFALICFLVK